MNQGPAGQIKAHGTHQGPAGQIRARGTNQGPPVRIRCSTPDSLIFNFYYFYFLYGLSQSSVPNPRSF